MENENTVVQNAIDITTQADAVPVDEVNLTQFVEAGKTPTEKTIEQAEEKPVESAPEPAKEQPMERLFTRQEFDEAVRRKAEYIQRGLQNDPMYQLAQFMQQQYVQQGVPPEQAYAKAQEDFINKRAEALAADPQSMAKYMLYQQMPNQQEQKMEAVAQRLAGEIRWLESTGQVPEDFNLSSYMKADPEFLKNAQEFGAKAAIKMAAPMAKPIAPSLPQSIRPVNNSQPAPIDFSKMSSKEFAAFEKKVDAALLAGKKITI